jgi:hypothetical protein
MGLVQVKTLYPADKVARLAELARANQRSVAAELRVALDRHLADAQKKKGVES